MATENRSTERPRQPSPADRPTGAPGLPPARSRERVARRAYQIWQSHGCPCGTEAQDWLQAEAELKSAQFFRSGRLEARRRHRRDALAALDKLAELDDEAGDLVAEASIE